MEGNECMTDKQEDQLVAEELWHKMLNSGEFMREARQRQILRFLPGNPRCKTCYAPFEGAGSKIAWLLYHKRRSNFNPHLCTTCEEFARQYPGGTEIELTLLFADVRGSSKLAEGMSATEFGRHINRFYITATEVLANSDAIIDKIIGDQAAGIYVPGFAGENHAAKAIEAGMEILRRTGHSSEEGPWIPLGVGVQTGTAFVGSLGKTGATDITVLGDVANTAARLSSSAGIGEILVGESACQHANFTANHLEKRQLELRGKNNTVLVTVVPGKDFIN